MSDSIENSGQVAEALPLGETSQASPSEINADNLGGTQPATGDGLGGVAASDPNAGSTESVETFWNGDPSTLSEELQPIYKNLQGDYTRAKQGLSEQQDKVKAYDTFLQDPVGTLKQLATQYGYQLQQPGDSDPQQQQKDSLEGFAPNSWDEVFNRFTDIVDKRFESKMKPVVEEVNGVKRTNLEKDLDSNFPDWRKYESQMVAELKANPGLVGNPAKLYKLAVPDDVLEARATQRALSKLQGQRQAGTVSTGTTTSKQVGSLPDKPTISQAAQAAKEQLKKRGIVWNGA